MSSIPLTVPERLAALRAQMKAAGLAAYLVPSTDAHQSEYVPACWQRRQWISGFSGSAGDVVVAERAAGLWTDGRYFLQAAAQLAGTGIELHKLGVKGTPTIAAWLASTLKKGQALGADPRLLSRRGAAELREALEPKGVALRLVERNLVDAIWKDRPTAPLDPIEVYPLAFAGESVAAKLARLRAAMAERGVRAHVITALDCIAWLFNIRSQDVRFNPVVIANALITRDAAVLFCDLRKLTPAVRRALQRCARVEAYEAFGAALQRLAGQRAAGAVWVDGGTLSTWVLDKLGAVRLVDAPSPIWKLKAAKNAAELAGIRAAHVRDGVALVRFLAALDRGLRKSARIDELEVARGLSAIRAEGERYRGESFETIAGYAAHGAIVHYAATPESCARLRPRGLLLIDSGAQYLDGTTDVTRTVLLGGRATTKQRDRFTRVLKGHIAVARARFPEGTAGRQLDTLARHALWSVGLDYAHGTGHGVGCYLSVHEGPQAISATRCTGVPLEVGNVLSNEPGYYREGKYGIRIENLVEVVRDEALSSEEKVFLGFRELTLVPIDTRLVAPKLLAAEERTWLNRYHRRVRETLSPLLDEAERRWLRTATRAV